MMDQAEAHKEQRYNVVLAEVDSPEGFAIAERAIRLPSVSLWLASHEDPMALARSFKGDLAQRFKIMLEKADGWTRYDHLDARPSAKPQTAAISGDLPVKAVSRG
jgi:hypothetical protein